MATIDRSYLQALGSSVTTASSITDVNHLSSYNWIEAAEPTIAVPGSPPSWAPPKTPQKVPQDSGFVYIDQNAARHPDSPLEPLFRSLFHANPTFDISSVDVITDRNNIRKLLYFVNPKLNNFCPQPFTIKAEVVGKTIIFSRDENATYEIIKPGQFRGFGHNFAKWNTCSESSLSTGHHRIISYSFGGLKFVVRHETDGYVKTLRSPDASPCKTQDETSIFCSPHLGTQAIYVPCRRGEEVPIESTLEIKTRAMTRRLEISDVAAQLWISQTPMLVRAYHNRGTFQAPQVEDITAEIKAWESDHEGDLNKLGGLIQKVVSTAKECAGSVTIKYDASRDELKIEKAAATPILPEDLYFYWDSKKTSTTQHARTGDESTPHANGSQLKGLEDVRFSNVIKTSLYEAFRKVLDNMSKDLADYQRICESMKHLGIDALQGRQIHDLMSGIRKGEGYYDSEEHLTSSSESARDSAFRLLLDGAVLDDDGAYEATLFVVSNSSIFPRETRKMVLAAYKSSQFVASRSKLRRKALEMSFGLLG
ncbi:unnamed protein product [Clonostachys rhizophaga]|uniref:Uncharacterized protein n=1 Tax=Clonostachys rhizophaga TaxID=160324 RepID=A0A9N9VNI0_9HYPO|nr:unnamed protein product [Clonostachys rhizophaga]